MNGDLNLSVSSDLTEIIIYYIQINTGIMNDILTLRMSFSMDRRTHSHERSPYFLNTRHVVPLEDSAGRPTSHLTYVFQGHSPKKGI